MYLKSTYRSLLRELHVAKAAGKGPAQTPFEVAPGVFVLKYKIEDVLAFVGGVEALFHRDDEPDLFRPVCSYAKRGVPSQRLR